MYMHENEKSQVERTNELPLFGGKFIERTFSPRTIRIPELFSISFTVSISIIITQINRPILNKTNISPTVKLLPEN